MKIADTLKLGTQKLGNKVNVSALEAEILLCSVLKTERAYLLSHREKELTNRQISQFNNYIARRIKGEPIAYILGKKEFYGLEFIVNRKVLVPRPETELMVEEALKFLSCNTHHITCNNLVIDIGTGSGCVIISIIKEFNSESSELIPIGIDISVPAISIAKKNAKLHGLDKKIKFVKGDLLRPILNSKFNIQSLNILLLANLPYVSKKWIKSYSTKNIGLKFEPEIALFTGKNGLELYEKLFKQVKELISLCPASVSLLCEFDPRQTLEIKKLAKRELSGKGKLTDSSIQIIKDLGERNRILRFSFTSKASTRNLDHYSKLQSK